MSSSVVAKLSCEQCQQRKKKCDKRIPCGACQQAGITCTAVQRQRLPRGRTAQAKSKEASLKARVKRLESVVSFLQNAPSDSQPPELSSLGLEDAQFPNQDNESQSENSRQLPEVEQQHTQRTSSTPDRLNRFMAPNFWNELSDAITGLRDVLEDEDSDDLDDDGEIDDANAFRSFEPQKSNTGRTNSNSILFPAIQPFIYGDADTLLKRPPNDMRMNLLGIYQIRIDPIFKLLHVPTIEARLANPNVSVLSSELRALELCMCFSSLCTLGDHEIEGRSALVERYRLAAELSLVRAKLLNSTKLEVLQAFVIYLIGLRTCEAAADEWTLVAIAVRIGTAQGLDILPPPSAACNTLGNRKTASTLVDLEVKRRVWSCIGLIDLQASFDRGSRPLVRAADLERSKPMNVDDAHLSILESVPEDGYTQDEFRFTDMSFCLMVWKAMTCERRIIEVTAAAATSTPANSPPSGTKSTDSDRAVWDTQSSIVAEFGQYVEQLTKTCQQNPAMTLFQKYTIMCGQEILLTMNLLLRRPMQRSHYAPPPPEDTFDVLSAAIGVLDTDSIKEPTSEYYPWAWQVWPKWFALAIVLAELCSRQSGSSQLIERAWVVAQDRYEKYGSMVADTHSGRLWKPIVRLMRKVKELRSSAAADSQHTGTLATAMPPQQQQNTGMVQDYAAQSSWTGTQFNESWQQQVIAPSHMSDSLMSFPTDHPGPQQQQPTAFDQAFERTMADANNVFGADNGDAMSMFNWGLFLDDINNQSTSPGSSNE